MGEIKPDKVVRMVVASAINNEEQIAEKWVTDYAEQEVRSNSIGLISMVLGFIGRQDLNASTCKMSELQKAINRYAKK